MDDFGNTMKIGLWTALATAIFAVIALYFTSELPVTALIAGLSLMPIGGFVVAVLIKLSFEEHHAEDYDPDVKETPSE